MSNVRVGKFLLNLYERTGNNELICLDRYEIGKEIGLVDKVQTDHIVEILAKDGFVNNDTNSSKIRITEQGIRRLKESILVNYSFL
jgi:predicted transcriptional regulator